MKVGIMQPYFFPYIGYFQLINGVDEFVVYDNIQFTKKGWINRNRILVNSVDAYLTFPVKNDSDFLNVKDRYLADSWDADRKKMINRITESYRKAPNFQAVFLLIKDCLLFEEKNLFLFLFNAIQMVMDYLDIKTKLVVSSTIPIDHSLKAQEKVISICKALNADTYINPIGGIELYSKENFELNGIQLHFIKSNPIQYTQFNNEFIPWLSILDVMMFNSKECIQNYLQSYSKV
jgi:hypothetical protein